MILQALHRYYDRMAARGEAEEPGWGKAQIGWAIELSPHGDPVAVLRLQDLSGKKPRAKELSVPAPVKRTVAIAPNTLWDKTAYVLGRTADEAAHTSKEAKRTADEHAAFKQATLELIGNSKDPGLLALRRFLEKWIPAHFDASPFTAEMLDANVVFRLEGEHNFVHERPAVRALLKREVVETAANDTDTCLITGQPSTPTRLHPTIKGVNGAQTAGASLVSFNLDAFKSYGRDQGANAPVSEQAAERYGAALNALLSHRGRNRLSRGIGDATVVFWADASGIDGEPSAVAAEELFMTAFAPAEEEPDPPANLEDDRGEAAKVRDMLTAIVEGRPQTVHTALTRGVRFHVLGLSPNAARLSVRFWLSDSLEHLAKALLEHMRDIEIEPAPRFWSGKKGPPEIWRLLVKTTAVQEKFENVPPQLAGELTRAVLTDVPYPRTWLVSTIMRLRAGDPPDTGWHAAAIKACINRNPEEEDLPVALDPDNTHEAYQLGRLFAVLEAAQRQALGPKVNATIVDRYYASASSTPARVFPTLMRGARVHISDARKQNKGFWIESRLNSIMEKLGPQFPLTLRLEDQGRFAVGYYHERAYRGDASASSASSASDSDEVDMRDTSNS